MSDSPENSGPRIDIYVDGSWLPLQRANRNRAETGGWGGVIRVRDEKGSVTQRQISGPVDENVGNNNQAEIFAILSGLREAKTVEYAALSQRCPDCQVVLHSDSRMARISVGLALEGQRPTAPTDSSRIRTLDEIVELMEGMKATMEYARDPKRGKLAPHLKGKRLRKADEPLMGQADALANQAAWQARLDQQGYVYLGSEGPPITGDDAQRFIQSLGAAPPSRKEGASR